MRFMGFALGRGHTAMCSDFSLKSLIFEWSEEHLGPNPFMRVGRGECSAGRFQLEFTPSDLENEEVPQQLQVVGQLCRDQGKAVVACLDNTILYTVNPQWRPTPTYDLKVLSVVTEISSCGSLPGNVMCSVGASDDMKKGIAGHVVLTYANGGGQLVTSMGHWIELTRIDTNLEAVMRVAAHEFGEEELHSMQQEYASRATDEDRAALVQEQAQRMVQKSMPSRMKCKRKF